MQYIIINLIITIIGLIGCIIINKVEEGFFMGINRLFITIYLLILFIIALIINFLLIVSNLIIK